MSFNKTFEELEEFVQVNFPANFYLEITVDGYFLMDGDDGGKNVLKIHDIDNFVNFVKRVKEM